MLIKGYNFVQTCEACPEQYDVYDTNGVRVGYVRLRWGAISAECPYVGGACVYFCGVGDPYAGCFQSDEDRKLHFTRIARAIDRWKTPVYCPKCGAIVRLYDGDFDAFMDNDAIIEECEECEHEFAISLIPRDVYICKG